jgi:hypothetical protein
MKPLWAYPAYGLGLGLVHVGVWICRVGAWFVEHSGHPHSECFEG